MKKHLLLCSLLVVSFFGFMNKAKAQPHTPYAPNFILEDINGVPDTLYNYLDEGKYVVLDFFATWSAPSLESREGLQNLWNLHGPDGDDSMMLFSLEIDPETTDEATVIADYGIEYPVFTELSDIMDSYGVSTFPMFVVVCPDRTWKFRTGGINWDQSLLTSLALTCGDVASQQHDARMLAYNGEEFYCSGSANAAVYLQNAGTDTLKTAKIYAYDGTELIKSINWTGELLSYEMVSVPMVLEDLSGEIDVKFEVEFPNLEFDQDTSNDVLYYTIKEAPVVSPELALRLNTDLKASETSWRITSEDGSVIYESEALENDTFYLEEFLIMEGGCYTFEILDSFGDGLIQGPTIDGPANGFIQLISFYTGMLFNDHNYEAGTKIRFTVDPNLIDVDENEALAFSLSPNPASNEINIQFGENTKQQTQIEIVDALGRVITQQEVAAQSNHIQMNVADIATGVYFVKIQSGNSSRTERLIIHD